MYIHSPIVIRAPFLNGLVPIPANVLEPSTLELVVLDTAFSLKPFFLCSCDAYLFIRPLFGQPASPWYNPMYVSWEIKLLFPPPQIGSVVRKAKKLPLKRAVV